MPKSPSSRFALPPNTAMLSFALLGEGEGAPESTNAQLFPDGAFCSDDNRPARLTDGELKNWRMDAGIGDALIDQLAALKAQGKRGILFDYEHNSCYGDSRAAGWIEALSYQAGKGLFAKVAWTASAQKEIKDGVYCYLSPYFRFDRQSGAITELISAALTNIPALSELDAVGLSQFNDLPPSEPKGDLAMPDPTAALAAENLSLKADVVALSKERDDLKAQTTALSAERDALLKEKNEAALALLNEKHAQLLEAALSDGRLTPAQKPWAEKQAYAALSEYLEATKPLPITQQQAGGAGDHDAALTADEAAFCEKMGVTPDDFAKAKAMQP